MFLYLFFIFVFFSGINLSFLLVMDRFIDFCCNLRFVRGILERNKRRKESIKGRRGGERGGREFFWILLLSCKFFGLFIRWNCKFFRIYGYNVFKIN